MHARSPVLSLGRLLGAIAAVAALIGAATAAAPPTGAAPSARDLAVGTGPSQLVVSRALPLTTARALVVDHVNGRVFVSGDDSVVATDLDGTIVAILDGHPGAAGMVIVADTLYVAEPGVGAIGRISLGRTPTNATRIATGLVNPRDVAYAGGALWTVTGTCAANAATSLTRVALPAGSVTSTAVDTATSTCALLDGAGQRVVVARPGVDPGPSTVFDASVQPPTEVVAATTGMPNGVRAVAFSPDASLSFVAGSSDVRSFTTTTLAPATIYANTGAPRAVAITSARNGLVAVGGDRGDDPTHTNLALHAVGTAAATWRTTIGASVVPDGLAFNADGSTLYALAARAGATAFDLHIVAVDDATSRYGEFHPVDPQRVYDSRATGLVTDGTVQISGRAGVPTTGVSAVAVNVTVTEPTVPGYLTVYPAGQAVPGTSTLNFTAGQVVPNMALLGVSAAGAIAFHASQRTHVVIDVLGWFGAATAPGGSLFHPAVPSRWFDTRVDARQSGTVRPLGAGGFVTAPATAECPAVPGIGAVALNVTATNTGADGYLAVAPAGAAPGSSNLNWKAGETVPNAVISKVQTGTNAVQFTNAFGSTDVVADVFGCWDDGSGHAGTRFYPIAPTRVADTRIGYLAPGSKLGSAWRLENFGLVSVKVTGGLPAGATAVALNITAVTPDEPGFLSVFPLGVDPDDGMTTSVVNFVETVIRPNMAIVQVGDDGEVMIYNGSDGTIDIVVDITGYFR